MANTVTSSVPRRKRREMTLGAALDLIEARIEIPRDVEDRLVSFIGSSGKLTEAILASKLPARARLLALALHVHPSLRRPFQRPAWATMGEWTGLSARSVQREWSVLADEGWLHEGPEGVDLRVPGEEGTGDPERRGSLQEASR